MKHKAARLEYLRAVAQFERGCLAFAEGMQAAADASARPGNVTNLQPDAWPGPRKPAKRARDKPLSVEDVARMREREATSR